MRGLGTDIGYVNIVRWRTEIRDVYILGGVVPWGGEDPGTDMGDVNIMVWGRDWIVQRRPTSWSKKVSW